MPTEVIELGDESLQIVWNKTKPCIQVGIEVNQDFAFSHINRGRLVIDSELYDSLWVTIETRDDALRLISAIRSAAKYLP